MSNGVVKYTSKDFQSIKQDLVDSISSLTSTWTSREDSDPGIVLVKCMSALGDMLSYNFDKQVLEYYAPTVTQRKNAVKLFELVGYHMHWYRAARTTVTLTYNAPMPEYIGYLKQAVDASVNEDGSPSQELLDAYYNYRNVYRYDRNPGSPIALLSVPPITDTSVDPVEIQLPSAMVEAQSQEGTQQGYTRPALSIGLEGSYPDNEPLPTSIYNNTHFRENSLLFKQDAVMVYNYWLKSTNDALGIHTYINDPQLSLELYPENQSSLVYSLIPEIENVELVDGVYEPTVYLFPYAPKKLKAIQGVLKSTNFTKAQLKNNRFYIPESSIDDEYMYVSYTTVNTNTNTEKAHFLKKTDNLLLLNAEDLQNRNLEIYFQFKIDDFDYPYIELSSYWDDAITEEVIFTFYYFKTQGAYGNITSNYLSGSESFRNSNVYMTNADTNTATYDEKGEQLSAPGRGPETAKEAYVNSLNYIMTYNTLVTIYDFERYTTRQDGISNSLAVDRQRLIDLNTETKTDVSTYTKERLQDILGTDEEDLDKLRNILCNIRKIVYNYKDAPIQKEDATQTFFDVDDDNGKPYTLNIYPVYGNFALTMSDSLGKPLNIAKLTNIVNSVNSESDEVISLPYYLYKINTDEDIVGTEDSFAVAKMLDNSYRFCQIVNVSPQFTALRVFNWRCCGILHLTKLVDKDEARTIVENVINKLKSVYTSYTLEFGKKITYMDLIQVVMNCDTRIRYFDAGFGNNKLIQFENASNHPEKFFNVEAYFNKESIMRYVQTIEENYNESSKYYNWLSVDPSYIQSVPGGGYV